MAGVALLLAGTAAAQAGPVTIVVPYTPGTGMDILARLLAPALTGALGQPVVVDNRPGASGNIGTQAVARAAPDGRTLLLQANTFVINPHLFRDVIYDPVASFTPIVALTTGDLVLAVNPAVEASDVRAFVDLAKRQSLDYASPGIGTPQHLAMALLAQLASVDLNHVPYRGSAPAIQDLLGRRVAAMVLPVHTALPLAAAGQVRLLAVGNARRIPAAPEVPTMAEAGFPGAEVGLWYGLLGPAGLPGPVVERINAALNGWLAQLETAAQLRAQGMTALGGAPGVLAGMVSRDLARWGEVIRATGITAEG